MIGDTKGSLSEGPQEAVSTRMTPAHIVMGPRSFWMSKDNLNLCREPGHIIRNCRFKREHNGNHWRNYDSGGTQQRAHSPHPNHVEDDLKAVAWCNFVEENNSAYDTGKLAFMNTPASSITFDKDSELD